MRITQQERENDLRFCDLLTASLSVPPPDSSPTTQYGKDRAAADAAVQLKIRELATRLECPNPPPPKDE